MAYLTGVKRVFAEICNSIALKVMIKKLALISRNEMIERDWFYLN